MSERLWLSEDIVKIINDEQIAEHEYFLDVPEKDVVEMMAGLTIGSENQDLLAKWLGDNLVHPPNFFE